MDTPKTKKAVEILNNLKLSDKKVTLVITEGEENLALSFRNLPTVNIVYADELNAYYALDNDTILFTKRALENLQEVRASGA
jgi:large subunit ribosomal protein L4